MKKIGLKIKRAAFLLWADIKPLLLPLILTAVYIVIADLIFGTMCPFAIFTGLPCPGCGITRATVLLLKFDFAAAFRMHACVYLWVLVGLVFVVRRYFLEKKKSLPMGLLIVVGCIMIIYWIWRLVTVYPGAAPMNYRERNLLSYIRAIFKAIMK